MKKLANIAILSLIISFAGCKSTKDAGGGETSEPSKQKLVPYTDKLKKDLGITDEEEKNLEFYTSNQFKLTVTTENYDKSVSGSVTTKVTRVTRNIDYPVHTVGILHSRKNNQLNVQYEKTVIPYVPKDGGLYKLPGDGFVLDKVNYAVTNPNVHLLIDLNKFMETRVEEEVDHGKRIGESSGEAGNGGAYDTNFSSGDDSGSSKTENNSQGQSESSGKSKKLTGKKK